jgi:hypothetical protein
VQADQLQDPEALADVKKAIRGFNESVPYSAYKVRQADIVGAKRSLNKKIRREEKFQGPNRDARKIFQQIQGIYPDPNTLGDIDSIDVDSLIIEDVPSR